MQWTAPQPTLSQKLYRLARLQQMRNPSPVATDEQKKLAMKLADEIRWAAANKAQIPPRYDECRKFGPAGFPYILPLLEHESSIARHNALRQLALMDPKRSVLFLLAFMEDHEWQLELIPGSDVGCCVSPAGEASNYLREIIPALKEIDRSASQEGTGSSRSGFVEDRAWVIANLKYCTWETDHYDGPDPMALLHEIPIRKFPAAIRQSPAKFRHGLWIQHLASDAENRFAPATEVMVTLVFRNAGTEKLSVHFDLTDSAVHRVRLVGADGKAVPERAGWRKEQPPAAGQDGVETLAPCGAAGNSRVVRICVSRRFGELARGPYRLDYTYHAPSAVPVGKANRPVPVRSWSGKTWSTCVQFRVLGVPTTAPANRAAPTSRGSKTDAPASRRAKQSGDGPGWTAPAEVRRDASSVQAGGEPA